MTKILAKLHAIMTELDYIQKDKKNAFHGYNYASEKAIKEAVHAQLVKHGVVFLLSTSNVRRETFVTDKQKRGAVTDLDASYKFYDVESGEFVEGTFTGCGDDGADKGTYKAITGAIKYILTTTFLIPTGDDPEEDKTVEVETKPAFIPKTKTAPKPLSNLPPAPFDDEPQRITKDTIDAIETVADLKGFEMDAIKERALAKYGVPLDKTSEQEGQEILKKLSE